MNNCSYKRPHAASLLISEACNLNCSYCFEKDKKNINMSESVALQAYDFLYNNEIQNRKDGFEPQLVVITMFGGEPLINWKSIKAILEEVKRKPKETRIQTVVDIITNGTIMNQEIADYIKDYIKKETLSIQVSVDGVKKIHDFNRVDHSGEGSFNTIEKNIPLFKYIFENCSNPNINESCLHLHGSLNHDTINGLYEAWKYFRFTWKIPTQWYMPIHSKDWTQEDVDTYENQLTSIVSDILNIVIKNNSTHELEALAPINKSTICYIPKNFDKSCGAGGSYCSITALGDIYPCHQFYYSIPEETKIGTLDSGIDYNKTKIFANNTGEDSNCAKKGCKNYKCYRCLAENYAATGTIYNCDLNLRCKMSDIEERLVSNVRNLLISKGIIKNV